MLFILISTIAYLHKKLLFLGTVKHMISISNVIVAHYEHKSREKGANEVELFPNQYFVLHFAKRIKKKWKPQSLLFCADETSKCQAWVEGIQGVLKGNCFCFGMFFRLNYLREPNTSTRICK